MIIECAHATLIQSSKPTRQQQTLTQSTIETVNVTLKMCLQIKICTGNGDLNHRLFRWIVSISLTEISGAIKTRIDQIFIFRPTPIPF